MEFLPFLLIPIAFVICFGPNRYRQHDLRMDFPSFKALVEANGLVVFEYPKSLFSVKNKIGAIYNGKMVVSQYADAEQLATITGTKIKLLSPFQE